LSWASFRRRTNRARPGQRQRHARWDPLGESTVFEYDTAGDAKKITTGYHLMPFGPPPDPSTNPNVAVTRNEFNDFGDLIKTTDSRGVSRTFNYDENGNQTGTSLTWVNPSYPDDTQTITTTDIYDAEDQLTTETTPTGTTTTLYDFIGRAKRITDNLNGVTGTTYDARGFIVETSRPDGRITRSVYDAEGRAIWTDDPHLPGQPTDGTHTVYFANGPINRTERYADVVIDINAVRQVGFLPPDLWVSLPPSAARLHLLYCLRHDLSYGAECIPKARAEELLTAFFLLCGTGKLEFFTNNLPWSPAVYDRVKNATETRLVVIGENEVEQLGWGQRGGEWVRTGLSQSGFDTGVVVVSHDRAGILWFEDED
jgi:YD repeat-containing protein